MSELLSLAFIAAALVCQQSPASNAPDTARFASGDEMLIHGDHVTITRAGNEKVSGVFVWSDTTAGRIYIRRRPGEAPVAVAAREITKVERIAPAALSGDKGSVKPAIEGSGDITPSYEIHVMTVHNGSHAMKYYFGSSLSDTELDQLHTVEQAANEVAKARLRADLLLRAMDDRANFDGTPGLVTSWYPAAVYPVPFNHSFPVIPAGFPLVPAISIGGPYLPITGNGIVFSAGTDNAASRIAVLTKELAETRAALAKAQQHLANVSGRVVEDSTGHIVAVRLQD